MLTKITHHAAAARFFVSLTSMCNGETAFTNITENFFRLALHCLHPRINSSQSLTASPFLCHWSRSCLASSSIFHSFNFSVAKDRLCLLLVLFWCAFDFRAGVSSPHARTQASTHTYTHGYARPLALSLSERSREGRATASLSAPLFSSSH